MSLDRVRFLVLLAGCVASAPALAQQSAVRLVPASMSLGTPPPRKISEPDMQSLPKPIEIIPQPMPLPSLTPMPPPTPSINVSRLQDQLRVTFPSSAVRLTVVGDQLVLTGHAADTVEAQTISDLVSASANGRQVTGHLRIRGRVVLHVLALEVDRRAAAQAGLPMTNGVSEQARIAAAVNSLTSSHQATVIASQSMPVSEGKTSGFSARRCQVTLCAGPSADSLNLAVTARFSPADRCILAQALQTVVEMRPQETLVLTSYSKESVRDIVLIVTPEFVDRGK